MLGCGSWPVSLLVIINYCNGTEGKVTGGSLLILSSSMGVCLHGQTMNAAPFLDLPLNLHTREWILSKFTSSTSNILLNHQQCRAEHVPLIVNRWGPEWSEVEIQRKTNTGLVRKQFNDYGRAWSLFPRIDTNATKGSLNSPNWHELYRGLGLTSTCLDTIATGIKWLDSDINS